MPGGGEILVILILVLLLFGPDKLPDLARQVGRGVRELNRMKNNLTDQFNLMDDETPHRANTSSTRNAALPEAEETEESHGWESYAARRSLNNDSGRNDFGSDALARDEDDIAEDAALATSARDAADDSSDWRNCEQEPSMQTENAFSSTTLNDDFPVAPRAISRAAAPNKMRNDEAV